MIEEFTIQKLEEAKQRFWKQVDVGGESDCWNWTGAVTRKGYGRFYDKGKHLRAHRFSWIISNGDIPDGLWVLHKCDNPACVNFKHLFLGTDADNKADMCAKGRQSKGEAHNHMRGVKHHNASLSEMDVREIRNRRQAGESRKALASLYGVSKTHITRITLFRSWERLAEGTPHFYQSSPQFEIPH